MDLKVTLTIQFFGILLLALLSFSLDSSLKSTALKYWKYAWLALCLASAGFYLALNYQSFATPFFFDLLLGRIRVRLFARGRLPKLRLRQNR
jgi:hypothetical protein